MSFTFTIWISGDTSQLTFNRTIIYAFVMIKTWRINVHATIIFSKHTFLMISYDVSSGASDIPAHLLLRRILTERQHERKYFMRSG